MSDTDTPTAADKNAKVTTTIRLSSEVMDAIDARAKAVGLNRSQWIERSAYWCLTYLPPNADEHTRKAAALSAPIEVAGYKPAVIERPW